MMNSDDSAKINMQGIHVSLTPALQATINHKFAALLRHETNIARINVRLHKDQKLGHEHHYVATAQVELPGPDLVAHAEDKDAYVALDHLTQKLEQLLKRKHSRKKDQRNHPHDIDLQSELPKVQTSESPL